MKRTNSTSACPLLTASRWADNSGQLQNAKSCIGLALSTTWNEIGGNQLTAFAIRFLFHPSSSSSAITPWWPSLCEILPDHRRFANSSRNIQLRPYDSTRHPQSRSDLLRYSDRNDSVRHSRFHLSEENTSRYEKRSIQRTAYWVVGGTEFLPCSVLVDQKSISLGWEAVPPALPLFRFEETLG